MTILSSLRYRIWNCLFFFAVCLILEDEMRFYSAEDAAAAAAGSSSHSSSFCVSVSAFSTPNTIPSSSARSSLPTESSDLNIAKEERNQQRLRSIELNKRIQTLGKQGCSDRIFDVFLAEREDFNCINYATTIFQISTIYGNDAYVLRNHTVFRTLLQDVVKAAQQHPTNNNVPPTSMSAILQSLGRKCLITPESVALVDAVNACPTLVVNPSNDLRKIAEALWACAKLQRPAPQLFIALDATIHSHMPTASPSSLSQIIWACAKLQVAPPTVPHLWTAVDVRAAAATDPRATRCVARLAWGYAKCQVPAPHLWRHMNRHAPALVAHGDASAVAQLVWAHGKQHLTAMMAKAGAESRSSGAVESTTINDREACTEEEDNDDDDIDNSSANFWKAIHDDGDRLGETSTVRNLADLIWACQQCQQPIPGILNAIETRADEIIQEGTSCELCTIACAYAQLRTTTTETEHSNFWQTLDRYGTEKLCTPGHPSTRRTQVMSLTLWSAAQRSAMPEKPERLVQAIDDHWQVMLTEGNTQEWANTAWASARLQMPLPRFFNGLATQPAVIEKLLTEGKAQEISSVVWSFAKLNIPAPALYNAVNDRPELLTSGAPRAMASAVWSFASLMGTTPTPHKLLTAIEEHAERLVRDGDTQAVANTLWGYATLGVRSTALLREVNAHAERLILHADPHAISTIAWSFATLRAPAPQLFAALDMYPERLIRPEAEPQALANAVWACAAMGPLTQPLRLLRAIDGEHEFIVERGSPQSIANTALALAKLLPDPAEVKIFEGIRKHSARIVGDADPLGVANLVSAFWKAGIRDAPEFWEAVDARGPTWTSGPRELAATVFALAQARIYAAPSVFEAVERNSQLLATQGNCLDLSNVAWALSVMDIQSPAFFAAIEENYEDIVTKGKRRNVKQIVRAVEKLDVSAPNLICKFDEMYASAVHAADD